jgi:hypothetical protein
MAMSTPDKATAPLIVVIGGTNDGFYVNPLDTISDCSTGIIYPEALKRCFAKDGESGSEAYLLNCFLRPAYLKLIVSMGLDEYAIGIKRMDTGISYMSFDVARLYWHRRMDYIVMALDRIGKITGRQLQVFCVTAGWTEDEVAQLKRHYAEATTVAKFEDVKPLLYVAEHQGV